MEILVIIGLLIFFGSLFNNPSDRKQNKNGLTDIEKFITFKNINKK